MLSIGELARRAGVSVRMLRHYDAMGLVKPQRVDPATGYRSYAPSQIGRVRSLVALKELGFSLPDCQRLLDNPVRLDEVRRLLRGRRADLRQRLADDASRLAGVERRLQAIETETRMTDDTLRVQPLPALRLAGLTATVTDESEIGTVVQELTNVLGERLSAVGAPMAGRICVFDARFDVAKIDVSVGVPAGQEPAPGLQAITLPATDRGAVVRLERTPGTPGDPWLTVDAALTGLGLESGNPYVQIDVEDGDERHIVELRCPVHDAHGACDR